MVDFGKRLKIERNRLGLNQSELSEKAGVTKKTQSLYERGERSPSAEYLMSAAIAGVDVLFLVTGNQTVQSSGMDLNSQEIALVQNYRASSDKNKSHIEAVGVAFSQQLNDHVNEG